LAADGRGLADNTINPTFAKLSEALTIASKKAAEEIAMRNQVQKKLALQEKAAKEQQLRDMASRVRAERSGAGEQDEDDMLLAPARERDARARSGWEEGAEERGGDGGAWRGSAGGGAEPRGAGEPGAQAGESAEEAAARRQRDELRADRKRERERDLRMEAAGKKSKTTRDSDRDVSEKIALGMTVPGGARRDGEVQYDQRLFNQSAGLSAGFGGEDDYTVYSKPLFAQKSESIYRPKGDEAEARYGDAEQQLAALQQGSKKTFRPDKDWEGVDRSAPAQPRSGPVLFEKAEDEADPFGLAHVLTDAKPSGRRAALDAIGGGGAGMAFGAGSASRSAEELDGSNRSNVKFVRGSK
jgi:SNW domain-containing protein 1